MVKTNFVFNYKLTFIIIFFSCWNNIGLCQDIHLTQYYTSSVFLNPALTGNFNGDVKVVVNSRSQWSQVVNPLMTSMISIEKKILRFPDEIGVGLIISNDLLTTFNQNDNKIYLSGSYTKKLKGHQFRLGVQGGVVSNGINLNKLTFNEQWRYANGDYDPNASNMESGLQSNKIFPNLNAGIAWVKLIKKVRLTAAYSFGNINRPKPSYKLDGDRLAFKHTANLAALWNFNTTLSITPHLLYMTSAKAVDFLTGVNVKKMLKPELGILIGGGYRGSDVNNDACIAVLGGFYKRFEAAISTDFNISSLSNETKRKLAWEISIIYITPSRIAEKITIPCDRY